MDLLWIVFTENPQLFYQFLNIPFALLLYYLARQGHLSIINRCIYLALGGVVLAIATMGPYSFLLFFSAGFSLLLMHILKSIHMHQCTLGLQMCWQTFWHLYIHYQRYWLEETPDSRLLMAVSALMLMTQRVSSLSLDLQEGSITSRFYSFISFLTYLFCFPSLLGGPLCSFETFTKAVRHMGQTPPLASSLEILAIWILSLMLKMNYYAHWKASECVNNAAGMGFHGNGHNGKASWDGLSDGNPWVTETCSRPSAFAREWNRTTAAWLRRMVFQKCDRFSLFMTFGFSAWWHGLHPGQILGFLIWATTVQGDYKLHHFLQPKLTSPCRKRIYVCVSWVFTQLTIACVVVCVEIQSLQSVRLLCSSYIAVFPFLSLVFIIVL